MEIKRFKTMLASLVIIGLTFTACSGDDGDTGPRGPAGNDGADGVDGVVGGAEITSLNVTVVEGDWAIRSSDSTALEAIITDAALTSDVISKGLIQVFQETGGSGSGDWLALPFTQGAFNFGYSVRNSEVVLRIDILPSNAKFISLNGVSFNYRIVIIPSSSMIDGVDATNYEELQSVYGIDVYDIPQFTTED